LGREFARGQRTPKSFPACARLGLAFFLIGSAAAFAQPAAQPILAGTTVSSSRQFTIEAEDPRVRSNCASFVEQIRQVWIEIMGPEAGAWEIPVHVMFPRDQRRRPRAGITLGAITGDGNQTRLQLTVWDPSFVGSIEFAGWIFQALALEFAARATPLERSSRLAPPWMTQAWVQTWLARREPVPTQMLEGLLGGSRPPTAASLLRRRSPAGSLAEITTFRILSWSLWRTLAELPDGRRGLRHLVLLLPGTDLNQEEILAAFPSLDNQWDRLERQWSLVLARQAYTNRTRLLSLQETGRELRRLLDLKGEMPVRGGEPEKLEGPVAMQAIARMDGGGHALNRLTNQLVLLETRANPLLAPVIREYREIAFLLTRRPRSNLRPRLESNLELQERVQAWGARINDELNTFEVNRQGPSDPVFQQMLRAQSEAFTPEPRRDAITTAIDLAESSRRK
jgi:hypothetical protein